MPTSHPPPVPSVFYVRRLLDEKRYSEARDLCQQICDVAPQDAEVWFLLGAIHGLLEDYPAAETCCKKALAMHPDVPDLHRNLGVALLRQGKAQEAEMSLRRALVLRPEFVKALLDLAELLGTQGNHAEAVEICQRLVTLKPTSAGAWVKLGILQQASCDVAGAKASYERAIELQPDHVEARVLHALILLLQGDYARGWIEYEWRWQWKGRAPRRFPRPRWDGAPLHGKSILLHPEQGLGDSIQFIRYAPMVKALGGRVVCITHPPLMRLFWHCDGVDQFVETGQPLPHFDIEAPLMSLPGIFGTTLANIPARVPYIFPPGQTSPMIDQLLSHRGQEIKVGLVWAGGPKAKNDMVRSCPWEHFARLAQVAGVRYYSLQKGPSSAEAGKLAERLPLTDLGGALSDFADTAGAIAHLDLVISVDTAVAHLAGAMDKPVWILLPNVPDWRWLLDRDDSPWYPTARLFRQRQAGDWHELLQRVTTALGEWAALRRLQSAG
jgi:Flp pilus assembly protein TadD